MTETMLDDNIREQVKQIFSGLNQPVTVLFFGSNEENCEYCAQTQQLMEELVALSDKLALKAYDVDEQPELAAQYHVEHTPGIVMVSPDGESFKDYGIRFTGIPAGHEFTSIIRDLLMISARDLGLSKDTKEYLASLDRPLHLQVFVTPTCPYCPQAVVLAHQMAMESPWVQAEMVEAMEFPMLADQFGVSGVPHTVINAGMGDVVGAMPEMALRQKIQQVMEAEQQEA